MSGFEAVSQRAQIWDLLRRGSIWSFAIQVGGTAMSFVSALVLARILGVADYGVYVYVLTWVGILLLPSVAGMDTAGLRFIGTYRDRPDNANLRAFLRHSRRYTKWLSVIVALSAASAIYALGEHLSTMLRDTFWVACVLLPISTRAQLQMSVLRAFSRPVAALSPEMILRPAVLIASVLIYYVLSEGRLHAYTVMGISAAAASLSLAVLSRKVHSSVGPLASEGVSSELSREWSRTGLAVMLVASFHLVLAQTDIILLGIYRGTTEAGVYAVAARLSMLVAFSLSAANVLLAPMISGLYSRGAAEDLADLLRSAIRWLAVGALSVAAILLAGGHWILTLFGPDFVVGLAPMSVLIAGQLINVFSGSVGFMLTMTGHHRVAAQILGAAAMLNVLLNIALIPRMGMVGAALSTAVTLALWNIAMLVYVRARIGIDPSVLSLFYQRS